MNRRSRFHGFSAKDSAPISQEPRHDRMAHEEQDTKNILKLIRLRELGSERHATAGRAGFQNRMQARIGEWAEQDFLQHCSAHGDHTVKIVSCDSGETLAVLDGHQRTPWVVRFNPVKPTVVASGSLDHAVIVWDSQSSQQLLQHNFGKPIASVAFHSQGDVMTVASGHKVYSWVYGQAGGHTPAVILKTRKSLRALHFHPLGCPVMLTAEVVERKSSASSSSSAAAAAAATIELPTMNAAIAEAQQQQQQPNRLFTLPWPMPGLRTTAPAQPDAGTVATARADAPTPTPDPAPSTAQMSALLQLAAYIEQANRATSSREHGTWMRLLLQQRHALQPAGQAVQERPAGDVPEPLAAMGRGLQSHPLGAVDLAAAAAGQREWQQARQAAPAAGRQDRQQRDRQQAPAAAWASMQGGPLPPLAQLSMESTSDAVGDKRSGQVQAGAEQVVGPLIPLVPLSLSDQPGAPVFDLKWGWEVSPTASAEALESLREHRQLMLHRQLPVPSLPEQPCIVNLILWPFSTSSPDKPLSSPLLQLPRTVLCSEMGTCFSRCGRYLAVCVASDHPSAACSAWINANIPTVRRQPASSEQTGCRRSLERSGPGFGSGVEVAAHWAAAMADNTTTNSSSSTDNWGTVRRYRPASSQRETGAAPLPFNPMGLRPVAAPVSRATTTTPFSPPAELQFSMDLEGEGGASTPAPARLAPATPGTPAPDAATAPRGPLYELRIYSLDGPTFGCILYARPIRAAHCLTSIQFSPTSRHLLVAYGRRHVSLCSLLVEQGQLTPVHTVVEVYRVRDMRLVRQLAVLEDEVNVAAWHPHAGGGLLYGTKEGKLRLFRHDRREPARPCIPVLPRAQPLAPDEELWEAEQAGRESPSDDDVYAAA